jgi:hypothetical protein
MSECRPESLEEAFKKRPTPPPAPSGEAPGDAPPQERVPPDMLRDPEVPGSIAATEKLVADLQAELDTLRGKAVIEAALAETSERLRQLTNIEERLLAAKAEAEARKAEVERGMQGFRQGLPVPLRSEGYANLQTWVGTINRLTSGIATIRDLKDGLSFVRTNLQVLRVSKENVAMLDGIAKVGAFALAARSGNYAGATALVASILIGEEGIEQVSKVYNNIESFSRRLEAGVGVEDLIGGLESLFPGNEVSKALAAWKTSFDASSAVFNTASYWLNEVSKWVGFAQAFLLAVCKLMEAYKQLFKNLQWLMMNLDALLATLVLNLIPKQVVFKLPNQPGLFLRAVDGLRSRLAGFSGVFKCFTDVFGLSDPKQANPTESLESFEQMYQEAVQKMTKAISDTAMDALGATPEEKATGNPMNVIRNNWIRHTGLNKVAPTPPVVMPDEGAILSNLNTVISSVGYVAGFLSGFFKPGVGDVQPEDMAMEAIGADGKPVAVHPHPANSIRNQVANATNVLSLARAGAERAKQAGQVAELLRQRARKEVTNAELCAGLVSRAGQTALSVNMLRDSSLEGLTLAAADWFACEANGKQLPPTPDGIPQGLKQPTEAELRQMYGNIPATAATLPFSPADLMKRWNKDLEKDASYNTEKAYDQLVDRLVRPGMTASHIATVKNLALMGSAKALPDLPILLLLENDSEVVQWERFKAVYRELDAADRHVHQAVYDKANTQGLLADSAFTFLAEGLRSLEGFTLLEGTQNFLRHDYRNDLLPFDRWTRSAAKVNKQVARPQGLTPKETVAAEASARFWETYKADIGTLPGFIMLLRTRADEYGGPAGYELFTLMAAVLMLKRIEALYQADTPGTDAAFLEGEVQALARTGQGFMKHVTHSSTLDEIFRVLAEER